VIVAATAVALATVAVQATAAVMPRLQIRRPSLIRRLLRRLIRARKSHLPLRLGREIASYQVLAGVANISQPDHNLLWWLSVISRLQNVMLVRNIRPSSLGGCHVSV
jgi:hypothetical protein